MMRSVAAYGSRPNHRCGHPVWATPRSSTCQMKILQMGPLSDRFDRELGSHHDVLQLWREPDNEALSDARAAAVEILVTSSATGAPHSLLERLTNLAAICSFGAGYEHIDVGYAKSRGVVISNTPGVLTDCTADTALALLLACVRKIPFHDRFVRDGRWGKDPLPLVPSLGGKRLGIVGLGRIGQAIAHRARAFNLEIAYTGRSAKSDVPAELRFEPSLLALAEWADFLVISCIGGPTTYRLISSAVLEALGPSGILVNISRGSVVDEPAMVAALIDGRLGGAGLDVFESEPHVPEKLFDMDNVVLLPHVGSATFETRQRMEDLLLDNINAFVRDRVLVTPI
jgi:hydroxypyruvate reductase